MYRLAINIALRDEAKLVSNRLNQVSISQMTRFSSFSTNSIARRAPSLAINTTSYASLHSSSVATPEPVAAPKEPVSSVLSAKPQPQQTNQQQQSQQQQPPVKAVDPELLVSAHDLHPQTVSALKRINITELFPVQHEILKHLSATQDLIVRSRTGSGKTLGFAIPVIDALLRGASFRSADSIADKLKTNINALPQRGRVPRALIITPTRELTIQIQKVLSDLLGASSVAVPRQTPYHMRHSPRGNQRGDARSVKQGPGSLFSTAVYGGASMQTQMYALSSGVDIVVGTPGRIMDLYERGSLRLDGIEQVVLDEADTMLDIGFIDDIRKIFSFIGPKQERRTMLFSATIPKEIVSLINDILKPNPVTVNTVEEDSVKIPSTLNVFATPAIPPCRDDVLAGLLNFYVGGGNGKVGNSTSRSLVFARTQASCNYIAESDVLRDLLNPSVRIAALHGGMTQGARERTMNMFRGGRVNTIIATDVAARGLDIPDVDLVVHFEFPDSPERFIHRTGRTARAGKQGTCAIMYDPKDEGVKRQVAEYAKAANIPTPTFPIKQVPIGRQDATSYSFSAMTGQPGLSTMKVYLNDQQQRVESDDIVECLLQTGLVKESGCRVQMIRRSNKREKGENEAVDPKGKLIAYVDVQLAVALELEKRDDLGEFTFERVGNDHALMVDQPEERRNHYNNNNRGGNQYYGNKNNGGRRSSFKSGERRFSKY